MFQRGCISMIQTCGNAPSSEGLAWPRCAEVSSGHPVGSKDIVRVVCIFLITRTWNDAGKFSCDISFPCLPRQRIPKSEYSLSHPKKNWEAKRIAEAVEKSAALHFCPQTNYASCFRCHIWFMDVFRVLFIPALLRWMQFWKNHVSSQICFSREDFQGAYRFPTS